VIKIAGLQIRTACQQEVMAESDGLLPIMMQHALHMPHLPSRCIGSITCPNVDCSVISARFSVILLDVPALDTKNIIWDVTPCILAAF
jgi:hypothetical protein